MDSGGLSSISSLFMCLILIGFRSSLVCIFNNLLMVWLPDVCPVAVPSTYLVELQDAVDGCLTVIMVPG